MVNISYRTRLGAHNFQSAYLSVSLSQIQLVSVVNLRKIRFARLRSVLERPLLSLTNGSAFGLKTMVELNDFAN